MHCKPKSADIAILTYGIYLAPGLFLPHRLDKWLSFLFFFDEDVKMPTTHLYSKPNSKNLPPSHTIPELPLPTLFSMGSFQFQKICQIQIHLRGRQSSHFALVAIRQGRWRRGRPGVKKCLLSRSLKQRAPQRAKPGRITPSRRPRRNLTVFQFSFKKIKKLRIIMFHLWKCEWLDAGTPRKWSRRWSRRVLFCGGSAGSTMWPLKSQKWCVQMAANWE